MLEGREALTGALSSFPQSFLQPRMAGRWWLELEAGYVEVGRWQGQVRRF